MKAVRFTRKKLLIGGAATLVAAVGARTAAASALSYGEGEPGLRFRFGSLEEAMVAVRAAAASGPVRTTGAWSWAQLLEHFTQGIEYSLVGYPESKPPLIRRTVGRLVHAHFEHQGYMKHDLSAAIPGAPALVSSGDPVAALARLEKVVADFKAHPGPLAPHFVYDALTKPEYDRIHAMHLANHLSELAPAGAA